MSLLKFLRSLATTSRRLPRAQIGAVASRIEGGTITGDGILRALTDEGLAGFGTIDTDIDFDTNTVLLADDGILNITGPILDVGVDLHDPSLR